MDIKMPVTSDVLEETVYIYAPLLLLDNMQKLPGSPPYETGIFGGGPV